VRESREKRRELRVELPSGGWVEIRDKLMAGDGFQVRRAAKITQGADSTTFSPKEMEDDQRNTLLGLIITGWSFPVPVPSQNSFAAADVVIGNAMDLDDYAFLAEAVQPLMDKIDGKGARPDPKQQPPS
jgi:hypothetical protein